MKMTWVITLGIWKWPLRREYLICGPNDKKEAPTLRSGKRVLQVEETVKVTQEENEFGIREEKEQDLGAWSPGVKGRVMGGYVQAT